MGIKKTLRPLFRNPGFTLTAVVVLGLGIGANTAIFTIVRAVLLRPLPYTEPDRIMVVSETNRRGVHIHVSGADFADWRSQAAAFAAIASYGCDSTSVVTGGEPERLAMCAVDTSWFEVMGVRPQIGRLFDPSEEKPNSQKAAVISESLWRRHFQSKPGVLGSKLKLGGEIFNIVGVLPAGFRFPDKTEIWVPIGLYPDSSTRSAHNYQVIARLKPGVSTEQAQAEMGTIAARLGAQYPDSNRDIGAAVTPLQVEMTGDSRPTLYLLLAAVAFVLLIACANVGSLLLAAGARRRTELAIRAALGAGRGRLVRQLLLESVVLSLAGGVVGLAFAWWSKDLLIALAPGNIPRLAEATIDPAVLAFGIAVACLTGILFGLAPAIQASRVDLNDALKQGTARAGIGGGGARLRSVLVCAEIAIAVVLVAGAGLALRSLVGLQHAPTGFVSQNVLVLETGLPGDEDANGLQAIRTHEEFLRRAQALPGVVAAGAVTSVPLSEDGSSNGLFAMDNQAKMERSQSAGFHTSSGGYFRTLGIPLRAGREFDARDQLDAPRVAIISETMAKKYWPRGDALGHRVTTGYDQYSEKMTIVGIVGDVRHLGLDHAPRPEIYVPFQQHPGRAPQLTLVVKTVNDPSLSIDALRREFRQLAPEAPLEFTTLDQVASRSVGSPRFRTVLLGVFAILALALAAIGLYGLMAYIAVQRTPEIGLRMALGASPATILALVLGGSLRLIAIGLGAGIAASLALTRYMQTMLYGIRATDPMTYVLVSLVLAAAALAASYVPAWRASQVDPVRALRTD